MVLRRPTLPAAGACLLSFAAFVLAQRAADVSVIDLMVYRAEGWAVRNGEDLYALRVTHADLPATYPPFAALLFLPLTLLDVPELRTLAAVTNLVLLVVLVQLSLRLLGRPARLPRPAAALGLAAVAVWCEPVWTTLRYGQVNLLLAALVLWDLTRRPGHRWAGVGIGVAAGIKLTPALFAVFLALCGLAEAGRRRRRGGRPGGLWNARLRQAAVATGAFLGTALLSAVVLPRDSHRFWTEVLFAADRAGATEGTANQSLHGVAARLLHTGDPGAFAVALCAVAAAAGLGTAVAAFLATPRRLPYAPAWAVLACAVTALLISPVSWSHHWVWAVPIVLLLGAEALRRGDVRWWAGAGIAGALFCSYALWWVPNGRDGGAGPLPELDQHGGEMLLSAVYPVTGTAFLAVAAAVSVRALRRPLPYEAARPAAPAEAPVPAETAAAGPATPAQAVAKE
ncbi:glycosyltransferase 87 family protein [Streptomyces sp. JJ36]|uniref:glycosyltransferase 87 family protein n=1 Tax=Streptomyces sp. JJ36 TaxID=2736645 RepID=UPI001F012828|nr:glycosyltransferase 87 family protein [Streptomyces sp. JJ36]